MSAQVSPLCVLPPVHWLFWTPTSETIPDICPESSPAKVRFWVQLPCATIGEGDGDGFADVSLQAARTMRATMPAARSMWSNVTHDGRCGADDPGDAIPGSRVPDRGRGNNRDLAGPPRGRLPGHDGGGRSASEPARTQAGRPARAAHAQGQARGGVLQPLSQGTGNCANVRGRRVSGRSTRRDGHGAR